MSKLQKMTLSEQYVQLESFYTRYGKTDGEGLNNDYINHPGFKGCLQWIFTPAKIVDFQRLDVLNLHNEKFAVVINIDLVYQLLLRGVNISDITFFSDCEWKFTWAHRVIGLPLGNIHRLPNDKKTLKKEVKKMRKVVDYTVMNVPFSMFKEFKELSQKITRKKVLMISGSQNYHDCESNGAFENVEYYKYFGKCFPNAQITGSLAIIDPNGVSSLKVSDEVGVIHTLPPNPRLSPASDVEIWTFAANVLDKGLPGYNTAEKGNISREESILVANGINVVFGAGKVGEGFTEKNRALTPDDLSKSDKFCWGTVDVSQKDKIGGLGKHKVVTTHATKLGSLGNLKYAEPEWGCGMNCWYLECESKEDAEACIKYLNHPDVVKLVKGLKPLVVSNSKSVWSKIPHHTLAAEWIDNYES